MRLDHVADAQGVDVGPVEAPREAARHALAAQLGEGVAVHRVAVVRVLVEREGVVVGVALREAHAVHGLARRDDDLAHAELAGRLDDVVSRLRVGGVHGVVGDEHVAGERGEVDDGVGRGGGAGRVVVAGEVEVGGEGVEDLAAVGQVGLEVEDARVVERDEVEVEDLVAALEELGDDVAAWIVGGRVSIDGFELGGWDGWLLKKWCCGFLNLPALPEPPVKTMRLPVGIAARSMCVWAYEF